MTIMRPRMVQHVNTGQLVTLMHFLVEVKKQTEPLRQSKQKGHHTDAGPNHCSK